MFVSVLNNDEHLRINLRKAIGLAIRSTINGSDFRIVALYDGAKAFDIELVPGPVAEAIKRRDAIVADLERHA